MSNRKILVVSDDKSGAASLSARLAAAGYEIATAAFTEMPAAVAADLVTMDVTGRESVGYLRIAHDLWSRDNVPVIFTAAAADEAKLHAAGMEDFCSIVSPFTERELRLVIELALSRREVKAAQEMEHRFFAESIDLLCFLDFNGYFKRLNPAWERTFGFTREELMSRPFIEFVHPDDRERTLNQNTAVREGGQARSFENRYLCKDGSFRWLRWNASPDSLENVIYSVARDVTETKRADAEREELVRELQKTIREVRTLQQILPICSYCRKIRDDENYWHTVETYVSKHTDSRFSHSVCPHCMATQVELQAR